MTAPMTREELANKIERDTAHLTRSFNCGASLNLHAVDCDLIVAALRGVTQTAPSAPTDAGALADEIKRYINRNDGSDPEWDLLVRCEAALRKSAPQEKVWAKIIVGERGSIALQETRGDDPVAWQYRSGCTGYEKPTGWTSVSKFCYEQMKAERQRGLMIGYEFRELYALPQQSPRLEREAIAAIVRRTKINVQYAWEGSYTSISETESLKIADAILALLSPDTPDREKK
jgi:hypothetical protein